MRTQKLGNSDLELTVVGLGTWAIGGPWQFGWGPQDDNEAVAAILRALDLGINWIDTAPIYGCGHSEELVGKALKQTKIKPIIATKCSLLWNEKREKVGCLKAKSIRKESEDSLKRLGIEAIDLYQMHWPDPEADIEEGWGEMARLKKEGKVRFIGVCNYNTRQLDRIRKIAPVTSLQPPYSMIRRDTEKELLPYCAEHNIGVVVYSPMQRGLLTGKFSKQYLATLAPDDHRLRMPEFTEPQFSVNLEFVEKLKPIAQKAGKTIAQLAIAWVLHRPEVTAAIVGARKPAQIAETAFAGDWILSQKNIDEIEKLLMECENKLTNANGSTRSPS
ncbi:MAG: aldo/keto reductase [Sedimentisphaerales bacterium]|nr:aldo/keto reductase [Sedimentisphaerales bacterium]